MRDHQGNHGNILGFFAGHTHVNNNAFSDGMQFITTACALADRGNGASSRTIGSLSENAWEIIQINPTRNEVIQYRLPGGHTDADYFKQTWQI